MPRSFVKSVILEVMDDNLAEEEATKILEASQDDEDSEDLFACSD